MNPPRLIPALLLAALLAVAGCQSTQPTTTDRAPSPPPSGQREPADTQAIRTSEFDVADLTYPELRDFEIPEPERVTLDNGLTLFLVEDRELPQVNASARLATGSVYAPAEKAGLASITGSVMRTGGTASMTPDELNQALENLGATVETGIGQTSGSAFMSTLKEHLDQVLPIFAEVVRKPAFAEEKVELAKRQRKSTISRRNDNARQIASRVFNKLIYGSESPYARTSEYYTVDAIERADLVDFHEQYFHPNNMLLSVWGDFDTDSMATRLRRAFGDWERAPDFEKPTPPEPQTERQYSVNFIQKDDVTQSTILMGHAGQITKDHPDYFPVIVMNEVLSGGFSSRLFQNVRKDKGLAYSVFGNYSAGYGRAGEFNAGVFTKSATTVEAANAVLDEIEKMRQESPTEDELSLAKEAYLNSFVFNFDTRREIVSRLMTYDYYGYPADFLQQIRQGVQQVTDADVQRVAEKYLHPSDVDILVVGRQQDFGEPLSALTKGGAVDTIDITIPTSPPGEEADAPAASEEEQAAGMEKLMQVRQALGGAAFASVENVREEQTQTRQSPRGAITIESTSTIAFPDRIHVEQRLPMGTITIVSDGEQMTMQTPQGTRQASPQMKQQINSQLWRNLVYLMAHTDDPELTVQDAGAKEVDGQRLQALRITPPAGNAFTLLVDPNTMRPQRIRYQATTRQGPADAERVYSDYQKVGDVMLPRETVRYQDGEQVGTSTTTDVTLNAELEEGLFSTES